MALSKLVTTAGNIASASGTQDGATCHATAKYLTDISLVPISGRPWTAEVTPSLTAATYDSGDIVINNATLSAYAPANDVTAVLCGIECLDKSDTAWGMNIVFHKASQSIGTVGAAITVSAANAANLGPRVSLFQSEAEDWINSKRWSVFGLNIPIKPTSGTDDVNFSIICNQSSAVLTTDCLSFVFHFKSNA